MKRRWVWIGLACVLVVVLLLPMPLAERFTSSTQQGQYLTHPLRAYEFIFAAATISSTASLSSSGEALAKAKTELEPLGIRPEKVELLFFPSAQPYSYTRRDGRILAISQTDTFIWEVWASSNPGGPDEGESDVVGLLDYVTGDLLAIVAPAAYFGPN